MAMFNNQRVNNIQPLVCLSHVVTSVATGQIRCPFSSLKRSWMANVCTWVVVLSASSIIPESFKTGQHLCSSERQVVWLARSHPQLFKMMALDSLTRRHFGHVRCRCQAHSEDAEGLSCAAPFGVGGFPCAEDWCLKDFLNDSAWRSLAKQSLCKSHQITASAGKAWGLCTSCDI